MEELYDQIGAKAPMFLFETMYEFDLHLHYALFFENLYLIGT